MSCFLVLSMSIKQTDRQTDRQKTLYHGSRWQRIMFLLVNLAVSLSFANAATVHDSVTFVPTLSPQVVTSFADNLTLSASNQFELFDSNDFIYAVNVSFDATQVIYPREFTTRLVFSTCNSGTDFDTVLTVFDRRDGDTLDIVELADVGSDGGFFAFGSNDMNCQEQPMFDKAATQVYSKRVTVLDDLLMYVIVDGFNGDLGWFNLTVVGCGTSCLEFTGVFRGIESCQCSLCADGFVLQEDGSCLLIDCVEHASGAPACSCDEGYVDSFNWNVTTGRWDGLCLTNCANAPDCDLLHREHCDAVPHTCSECVAGFVNNSYGNDACVPCDDELCVLCSGSQPGECLSCADNVVIDNGKCYTPCLQLDREWQLTSSIVTSLPHFGRASVNENGIVAIGSWSDDVNVSGVTFVYKFDDTNVEPMHVFTLSAKYHVSETGATHSFGHHVHINENDVITVSAPSEQMFIDGEYVNSLGAVYVFRRNDTLAWTQVQRIGPPDESGMGNFGNYDSALNDNDIILINAPQDDDNGFYSGSVFVYRNVTSEFVIVQKLLGDAHEWSFFGYSVDVSNDNVIVAGSYADDDTIGNNNYGLGSVYVFVEDTVDTWVQSSKLWASDGSAGDRFGISCRIDGSVLVVGALRSDRSDVVDDNAGAVYFFETFDYVVWNETFKEKPSNLTSRNFGSEISLAHDTCAVRKRTNFNETVESWLDEAVVIFQRAGNGSWVQQAEFVVACTTFDITRTRMVIGNVGIASIIEVDCGSPNLVQSCMDIEYLSSEHPHIEVYATDRIDPTVAVTCSHNLTDAFSIGETTQVTCTATDDANNFEACQFDVTVIAADDALNMLCPSETLYFSSVLTNLDVEVLGIEISSLSGSYEVEFVILGPVNEGDTIHEIEVVLTDAGYNVTARCVSPIKVETYGSCYWSGLSLICMPSIHPSTIRFAADDTKGATELLGLSQAGGAVVFDAENVFYFSARDDITIYVGDFARNNIDVCRILVPGVDTSMETSNTYPVTCLLPPMNVTWENNQDLHFQVYVSTPDGLAFASNISSDVYHYPIAPVITSASGCGDSSDGGGDLGFCQTIGGDMMTIYGSDLKRSTSVQVDGLECSNISHIFENNETSLLCILPSNDGIDRDVVVFQNEVPSDGVKLISYAPADVTRIEGCPQDTNGSALQCPTLLSYTGELEWQPTTVTLYGSNFGVSDATVFIGTLQSPNVKHNGSFPHSVLHVELPKEGGGDKNAVMIIQRNGRVGVDQDVTVSYEPCMDGMYLTHQNMCQNCSAGYYTNEDTVKSTCIPCDRGQFQDQDGSDNCKNCPAGRFADSPGTSFSCTDCPSGTYSSEGASECVACSVGKYQEHEGRSNCTNCPEGRFSNALGTNHSCAYCAAGKVSLEGSSECRNCSSDTQYAPRQGMSECKNCPPHAVRRFNDIAECWCDSLFFWHTVQNSTHLTCKPCNTDWYDCTLPGSTLETLILKPGFWRSEATVYEPEVCFTEEMCPGGAFVTGNEHLCLFPRRGPMCVQCVPGYVAASLTSQCEKCLSSSVQLVFFVLAGLAAILFCGVYVRRALRKSDQQKGQVSTLVKITLSAFQINSIAISFAFVWEGVFSDFIAAENAVSSLGTSALSFSCLVATGDDGGIKPVYIETLLYLLSGVIVTIIPMIVLVPYLRCTTARVDACAGVREDLVNIYRVSLPIIFFLLHPTLTQRTMNLFHCTDINGTLYLTQQLDERCWVGDHLMWVLSAGSLMIVLYVIGLPISAVYFLYKNQDKMHAKHPDHAKFHKQYSFLYKGYAVDTIGKDHYAWAWEAVVSARKIFLMFILVFFANDAHVQSLLGLLGVMIALSTHAYALPFESSLLNAAEFVSLLCSFITFYLGQFTYVEDVEPSVRLGASWVALIVNVAFLLIMIGFMFVAVKEKRDAKKQVERFRTQFQVASDAFSERDAKEGDAVVDRKRNTTQEFRHYRGASHQRFHIRGDSVIDSADVEMTTIGEEGEATETEQPEVKWSKADDSVH